MIVKVCGITCREDAVGAVECGANALGFNFYPGSPRFVGTGQAEEIIEGIQGAGVLIVAVVVANPGDTRPDPNRVSGPIRSAQELTALSPKFDALQIHGIDRPAELPVFPRRLFVAVSAENAYQFPDHEIIIDSSWGAGRVGNWAQLGGLTRPYILSGGLNPGNVGRAIEMLRPAGVDVCSGVESVPGRKDMKKIKSFVAEVRRAYGEF